MVNLKFGIYDATEDAKGIKQTTQTRQFDFDGLIREYKSVRNKRKSEAVLKATTLEERNELKSLRSYFTPYGTFSPTRKNQNIRHHNNLVCIDVDKIEEDRVQEVKQKLQKHPSTLLAIKSPSGNGVKALMLLNATYKPEEQYNQLKHVFSPYIKSFLGVEDDLAQYRLSQACFFSYDEEMYINRSAEPLALDFDYKEPERPEFKKSNHKIEVSSRIDKYIKTIADNKMQRLTPYGSRHQKLANVYDIASRIHYAPHLETELFEAFVRAGENMYSSKERDKRSGVRDSVKQLWNSAKRNPISDKTCEEILREINKKHRTNNNILRLSTRYIGQDKDVMRAIKERIQDNKYTFIKANPNMGKSTAITDLLKNEFTERVIFAAPTIAITEQTSNSAGFEILKGGLVKLDKIIANEMDEISTTFASLKKVTNWENAILVLDEYHTLINNSSLYHPFLSDVYSAMQKAKRVVFLSATPNYILPNILKSNILEIKPQKEQTKSVQPYSYDSSESKLIDVVLNRIDNSTQEVFHLQYNNKSFLSNLKDELISSDRFSENQIAKLTADDEDVNSQNYIDLISEQEIGEDIKVILTTSKIAEGVNVNNEWSVDFFSIGMDADFFIQGSDRHRKASEVKYSIILESSQTKRIKGTMSANSEYNRLIKELSSDIDFSSEIYELEEDTDISLGFVSRAKIVLGNKIINNLFAIIDEAQRRTRSYYNLSNFYEAVHKHNSNISFKEIEHITIKKDEVLEASRKEKKATREEHRKEMEILIKERPEQFIKIVSIYSKSKYISDYATHIELDESISYSEKLIRDDIRHFKDLATRLIKGNKISGLTLLEMAQKPCLTSEVKFDSFIKNNKLVSAIKNGAKTKSERILLERFRKISEALDRDSYDKNEFINILRAKLSYRYRELNTRTAEEMIGYIYDIKYNKHSKTFSLKIKGSVLICLKSLMFVL